MLIFQKKIDPAKPFKTPCPAGQGVKVSNCHNKSKVSILKATHREAVRTVVAAHVGIAAEEEQVARVGTTYGT